MLEKGNGPRSGEKILPQPALCSRVFERICFARECVRGQVPVRKWMVANPGTVYRNEPGASSHETIKSGGSAVPFRKELSNIAVETILEETNEESKEQSESEDGVDEPPIHKGQVRPNNLVDGDSDFSTDVPEGDGKQESSDEEFH